MHDTNLVLGGKDFTSRLIVGTGKYSTNEIMRQAHDESGAEIVTVAVRRVSLPGKGESILDFIDTKRFTLLPNTAGCYTADEAIRTAYLAREAGLGEMVKLEVIGDARTLFPDVQGLLEATKTLAREGFVVMPYTNDDPIIAKRLEDAGAACVMPLGAPIGSGLGIRNPYNIKIILETVSVPVIVDAGVHDDGHRDRLENDLDVVRVADAEAGADGRAERHHARGAGVLEALGDDRIVVRVGHDHEALARERLGGLQQPLHVGEERAGVADHLQLHHLAEPGLPREIGGADGLVGRVAAGRVRQQREALGVDEVEDRFALAGQAHAPHGDGDDLGAGFVVGLAHDLVRRILAGPDDEP